MSRTTSTKLSPAAPTTHRGTTIFPLVSMERVELPYALLEDALADGTVEIRESSERGTVPELHATNGGELDVLVLDGQQLVGAKQNRMASRTLVLPAGTKTTLPVSCIEQGRWHYTSSTFRPSRHHSPSRTRKSLRDVEARLAKRGSPAKPTDLRQAQSRVWREVAEYSEGLGVASRTADLDEVSERAGAGGGDWAARFPAVEGQVGLLAFQDGRPLGMDVVAGRSLYARLHDRFLRAYALDALEARRRRAPERPARDGADALAGALAGAEGPEGAEGPDEAGAPDESDALRFLADVQRAERSEAPTVGKGLYLVLSGAVVGAELVDGPHLAHRSAFEA